LEDEKLIDLFFARSEQAIKELSEKYGKLCHSIAFNILGDSMDADECENDTYLQVWNSIPPNKPKYLISYVCKIARNISLNKFKYNGRKKRSAEMDELLSAVTPGVLNKIINLETGSLAVEAALKMMLTRFYTLDGGDPAYPDRIPVFLVMADNAGGITGNYHGTTIFAQTLRGLWPAFQKKAEEKDLYRVESVPINNVGGFQEAIARWNTPPYKTAGFCHEIILMNYGGIRLREDYLQAVYRLCRENDTPILCDEIQSCAWYEGLYLFRQYGLHPDFVSIGKGFPGGNYPASKVLASGAFDKLSQFGALVTNGQEELASLSYLITMEFIAANGQEPRQLPAQGLKRATKHHRDRQHPRLDQGAAIVNAPHGEQAHQT
jgi:acetylornithine/succinyldiaminopimelate/putrescine aminotransferase